MMLASLKIKSVRSLSGFDSKAFVGQWPNWVCRVCACAWARYPLYVSLFIVVTWFSIPICVARSSIEGSPSPNSFRGHCTPSVGKFGSRPMACRMALLRMPSIVVSCRALSTPRWVAWYLDFRSCSTTRILYGGLSFRFVRALDNLRTSLLMCMKCSLKSSSGLMCTPNILYD